jgi:PGF-pre-PGF domain-containing protein
LQDLNFAFGNSGVIGFNAAGDISNIIIDNVIARQGKMGIQAASGSGTVDHNNITIKNSDISNNACTGLWQNGDAHYWLIQSNLIYDNAQNECGETDHGNTRFIYSTDQAHTISDSIVEKNKVYGAGARTNGIINKGHGIWFDGSGPNNIVRYNEVYDNTRSGILFEITDNGEIYGNVVHDINPQSQAWIAGISLRNNVNNHKIYNNVIYNSDNGIILAGNSVSCYNNLVKNNIAVNSTYEAIKVTQGCQNTGNGSGNVYEYNAFGLESSDFLDWAGYKYNTYDSWLAASSQSDTNVETDPLLTDPGNDDFTLQAGSLAIDAGVNLGAAYDDGLDSDSVWPNSVLTLDQDDYGTGWEIGAYVFGVVSGDNTTPTITSFSCSPLSVSVGQTITCSCSATDDTDPSPNVSYTANPSTSSAGTFITTCTATDSSENSASSNVSYVVTSSNGGDGNGGNGGGGETSTTPSIIENQSVEEITPQESIIFAGFNPETGIKQIEIRVKNEAQNIGVAVSKYEARPETVPIEKEGLVYSYLEIQTVNLGDNLDKAIITFYVNKTWVSENDFNANDIALFLFEDYLQNWKELKTSYNSSDDDYYYYYFEAESDDFGYFLVGEKDKNILESKFGKTGFFLIVGGVIVLIIVLVVVINMILKKKREEQA